MTDVVPAFRHRIAGVAPRTLVRFPAFWRSQKSFLAVIALAGGSFYALFPYTYPGAAQWEILSALAHSLAVLGILISAKAVAVLEIEQAIVGEIERRASDYLIDIKSGQRSRIDLEQLEETMLPNNPSVPQPAMIRLFQHICKEARDRKFESSVNIMQPYREEPLEEVFKLQNLQKIVLWLGILGTFIGLLLAIAAADFNDPDFTETIRKMFTGLAVSFSASVAGLQVAIILGMLLLVLRKRQEFYFKAMESGVVTMLSLARNAINQDDYLQEFSQINIAVGDLTDTVHSQNQEIKLQTEEIRDGLRRLAAARSDLDTFIGDLSKTQSAFIAEVRAIYDQLSLQNLTAGVQQSLGLATRLMSDKISVGTTQISNRLTSFNQSVDILNKVLEAQVRTFTTSMRENTDTLKRVVNRIEEVAARDTSTNKSMRVEMVDLSKGINALTRAVEGLQVIAPRKRSVLRFIKSLSW